MTLEFQNKKSDYIRFFKLYYLEQFWKRIYTVILLPLILGFCSAGSPFLWQRFFVVFGVFEVLILAIYYVSFWVSIWKFNKLQLNDPRYLERKKLSVRSEGLLIEYTNETTTIHWETMLSIQSYDKLLAVFLVDTRFLIIQINSFASGEEYLNFIGLVQSKVNKGYPIPKLKPVEKPPIY